MNLGIHRLFIAVVTDPWSPPDQRALGGPGRVRDLVAHYSWSRYVAVFVRILLQEWHGPWLIGNTVSLASGATDGVWHLEERTHHGDRDRYDRFRSVPGTSDRGGR